MKEYKEIKLERVIFRKLARAKIRRFYPWMCQVNVFVIECPLRWLTRPCTSCLSVNWDVRDRRTNERHSSCLSINCWLPSKTFCFNLNEKFFATNFYFLFLSFLDHFWHFQIILIYLSDWAIFVSFNGLSVGKSITARLVSSLPSLDSTASLHCNNHIPIFFLGKIQSC